VCAATLRRDSVHGSDPIRSPIQSPIRSIVEGSLPRSARGRPAG
jgi:hypothetical protein